MTLCLIIKMKPYIVFINLLQEILLLSKFPKMTPISTLILDQLALHEDAGINLTVRQVISFKQIASPATLHKHLASLRSSGYVSTISNDKDKRNKYLALSSLGHQYIDNLSKAIVQAAAT